MIQLLASKKFEEYTALSNVRLDIRPYSINYLLGESGSGKSTLLKLIAGLEDNDQGDIVVDGISIVGPAKKLVPGYDHIAYLSQDFKLQQYWTVGDNIARKISHFSEKEREDRVQYLLKLCGLEDHVDKFPRELSGGQQQRIAIAAVIVDQPSVVLLDEPFSNLDLPMKMEVRREVINMLREAEVTVVLVSHDPSEAMAVADHLVILDQGVLVQQGGAEEVYKKPKNHYVGKLLGLINELQVNGESVLIRPENIYMTTNGSYEGKVLSCAFAGMHYHVMVSVKGQQNDCMIYSDSLLRKGDIVGLNF